ncbi:MAG: hypothetical protein AAGA67_03310 [Cyanobacteria bacterium P01_F01_bin.153]
MAVIAPKTLGKSLLNLAIATAPEFSTAIKYLSLALRSLACPWKARG